MKTKIILDTNFLLIPSQFNVDVFSEIRRICDFNYDLLVVKDTVRELEDLVNSSRTTGKTKKSAKLALQMIKTYKIRTIQYRKVFKRADEAIKSIASQNTYVATQDRALQKELLDQGVKLIILRQKQYLKFWE